MQTMATQPIAMNQELNTLDKSKIAALQQKRTLAFINHFVITNVEFMNSFMCKCEHKLMQFERKLEKVNASMVLLESKLSSIPELDIPKAPDVENIEQVTETQDQEAQDSPITQSAVPVEESKETKTEIRPEYEKFVKMVQVGVPLQAVKLKVSLEGLDPNIFESIMNKQVK